MGNKLFAVLYLFIMFQVFFTMDGGFAADKPLVDSKAPYFKISSGDDEELTLDNIKGKVAVVFYETKETKELNRKLKAELNKYYESQPEDAKRSIIRLPVINCDGVFFPFNLIWKGVLTDNSKKEGITIYGDWDGKMFSSYDMKDKDSNFLIIGKDGIIKYCAAGKINDEETDKIKMLLDTLVK